MFGLLKDLLFDRQTAKSTLAHAVSWVSVAATIPELQALIVGADPRIATAAAVVAVLAGYEGRRQMKAKNP